MLSVYFGLFTFTVQLLRLAKFMDRYVKFAFLVLVFIANVQAQPYVEDDHIPREDHNDAIISVFSVVYIIIFSLISCIIIGFGMFRTESSVDCQNFQSKIDALNAEIQEYEAKIATVEQEIVEQKKVVRKNMKQLEKQGAEDAKLLEDKLNQIMGDRKALQAKHKGGNLHDDQKNLKKSNQPK